MIKKIIKFSVTALLFILLLILAIAWFVIYTQPGSRWALDYGLEQAGVDVSYASVEGNLAHGLSFTDVSYRSTSMDVSLEKITYQSDWTWFNWYLYLNHVHITNGQITLKKPTASKEPEPFVGFSMPLPIEVELLESNNLVIAHNPEAPAETIEKLRLKAKIAGDQITIDTLHIKTPYDQFDGHGEVTLNTDLQHQLDFSWLTTRGGSELSGKGQLNGGMDQLEINQDININQADLMGALRLQGTLNDLLENPGFELQIQSQQLAINLDDQTIQVTDLSGKVDGDLEGYQVDITTQVKSPVVSGQALPDSQVRLVGQGDATRFMLSEALIDTPEGQVKLQGNVSWQDTLSITSAVDIIDFKPQQIITEWPGLITGQVNLSIEQTAKGFAINSSNQLSGQLKGQDFMLDGSVNYAGQNITAEKLVLQLGENKLNINGQLSNDTVDLSVLIDAPQLNLLAADLAGAIEAKVQLSGDFNQPTITSTVSAADLKFNQYEVLQLDVSSSGQWGNQFTTELIAKSLNLNNNLLDTAIIKQSGWLDNHELEVMIKTPDIESKVVASGRFFDAKNMPIKRTEDVTDKVQWQGELISHVTQIINEQTVELKQPIGVKIGDVISIEPGCWQGVATGSFCFELNDIDQTSLLQGKATFDDFSLVPFEMFYPENLMIKGKVMGQAEFKVEPNNLNVSANVSVLDGQLSVNGTAENQYQTAISSLEIKAKTNNNSVQMNISSELEDGSTLLVEATIDDSNQGEWAIDSNIDGVFKQAEFLSQLSEEISEFKGELLITGNIKGLLKSPDVVLNISQPEGYLQLTRLGTLIEQSKFTVITKGTQNPTYEIKFSGINVPESNAGEITAVGQVQLNQQGWQLQGELTGDNFMVLNLPQAKFVISPKINFVADQQQMDLKGEISIDTGRVVVKQLPPSTISNSPDLVIQRAAAEATMDYQVSLDLKAVISEHIALDVIGLEAKLTGGIELKQALGKQLKGYGTMNLVDGTYEIYGQKLDIKQGELNFTGLIDNPRIKVKAARLSIDEKVTAGVELGGTVNNLKSELYSTPDLQDIEKLSYIMTGRGLDNANNLSGDQLKQAAIIMGLNQSSPIFSQIQNQFGIDVFTIKEGANKADTVVEAGKRLNDRLYVSYNQGIFNRLGYWLLKYRINDFLDLQSTQGEGQSVELVYTREAEVKGAKKAAAEQDK